MVTDQPPARTPAETSARTPVRSGLFVDGDPAALLVGRCGHCSRLHFPFADGCPYCGSSDTTEDAVPGDGRLWAWTAVTAPPPGYDGVVPFGFGVVELEAGLRVLGRLTESDPSQLHLGQAMQLLVVTLHDDVVTYAWAPRAEGSAS